MKSVNSITVATKYKKTLQMTENIKNTHTVVSKQLYVSFHTSIMTSPEPQKCRSGDGYKTCSWLPEETHII